LEKSITPESDKIYFLKKNQYVDICFNDKYPPLAHSFSIELGKSGLKTNPVCFSE
jgi:hypothetical protein